MKSVLDSFNFAFGIVGIGVMFRLGWLLMDYAWFRRFKRAYSMEEERQALKHWKEMEKLARRGSNPPPPGLKPQPPQGPPEKPQPTGGRLIRSDRDPGSPES